MDDQTLRDLQQIAQQLAEISAKRGPLIESARKDRKTWEQIADALHMSRAGVIKLYNQYKKDQESS